VAKILTVAKNFTVVKRVAAGQFGVAEHFGQVELHI
jgi:hypothetical protein